MNVFELTRALVDIESITNNEERVGELPLRLPSRLWPFDTAATSSASRWSRGASTCSPVGRAAGGHAFHAHRYVPPYLTSREDDDYIWGRGACDTKGIIASMIKAGGSAGGRRTARNFGLLFVVGEERN